ncbi:MAG: hypothetical protein IJ312_06130 [Treponema sp.]|nr:hypothetical protein [Treponema sp.]
MKKIIFITFFLFFITFFSFAATFFNGYTGIATSLQPNENSKIPIMTSQAFFAGQFDISGLFQLRTELSVDTENILEKGFFQRTPAYFSIDEISITTRFNANKSSHFIAAFLGKYESIGSDLFLQRQFGIKPINSLITETWLGLAGSEIYPFSGLGLAYMARFSSPQALAGYFYANKKDDILNLNCDLRFGGVGNIASLDFAAGVSFPVETKDQYGNDVFILIRSVDFHTGFSFLVGNRNTTSLFLQGGLKKLRLNPEADEKRMKLSDIYFIIEPRFIAANIHFYFSLFCIPEEMCSKLFYIPHQIGCNLSIFNEKLHIGTLPLKLGTHITLSAPDVTLQNINELADNTLSLHIAPFTYINMFGGTLNFALNLDVLNIKEFYKSLKFTIGFKNQL